MARLKSMVPSSNKEEKLKNDAQLESTFINDILKPSESFKNILKFH